MIKRKINACSFSSALILLVFSGYVEGTNSQAMRFSHLDSDALWLLKSDSQIKFKENQSFKLKTFLNTGVFHLNEDGQSEFEVKNARIPLLFKWQENGFAKLNIGLESLTNRFGPAFTDTSISPPNIIRQQNTNLIDAWMQYDFSSTARIRVGQDFVPYGLDSFTPSSLLRWSNFSHWAAQVSGRTRLHRDIGIQLYGQLNKLNYGVAIIQGAGISPRDTGTGAGQFRLANDNNDKKDIAARLTWSTPIQGLTVATSIYRGTQGDEDTTSYLSTGGLTDEHHTGVHAEYSLEKWYISIEHNRSNIDKMILPRSDGTLIRSGKGKLEDTTLSMHYKASAMLEPKFRYERFDSSSESGSMGDEDRIMGFSAPHNSYTVGINFNIPAFKGKKSFVLMEYIHIDEMNKASEVNNDRIEIYWKLTL